MGGGGFYWGEGGYIVQKRFPVQILLGHTREALFYQTDSGYVTHGTYISMVAQNSLRTRGAGFAIRSVKGSCLHLQQLQFLK